MNLGFLVVLSLVATTVGEDLPCLRKNFDQDSFVCVCNSTYCDNIHRMENPGPGKYILFSSDKASLRFKSSSGSLRSSFDQQVTFSVTDIFGQLTKSTADVNVNIDTSVKYQDILGFGGAVTDSTCINFMKLGEMTREHLIRSYFSTEGIEYNMLRVPIAGTDFSTHPYAYNEVPANDTYLTNYTLTTEDLDYKIPFVRLALNQAPGEVLLFSAAWSPPPWMKTNNNYGGYSMLRPEYYQTWALYLIKFLEEYKKEGIKIWGISTGNEPTTGLIPVMTFNSLGWTPAKQSDWIANYLGPMLRSSEFSKVKLLAIDDQRYNLPWWLNKMQANDNRTLGYIDGIALHFYWDRFIPASLLDATMKEYPDKFLLGTEACAGPNPWDYPKVSLGSWSRAQLYINNILENLNHGYHGWVDWNLALDEQGGPNWFNNFVDAPMIVKSDSDEIYKQPLFYAMGHFSKFIPRGSIRVKVDVSPYIPNVAFVTPTTPLVLVFYNSNNKKAKTTVKIGKEELTVTVTAYSINTLNIWPSIT